MNIKEIAALRKAGRLKEAFAAAKKEFSENANAYTAGALFWCLNDMYKTQDSNKADKAVKLMKSLYNSYCQGDEFMQKALSYATRIIIPHYREVKDAVDRAKTGENAVGLWQTVSAIYDRNELDEQLYQDFGWLIYYTLRQTSQNDTRLRKTLLHQYLKLELPRPSILHSLILAEGVRLEQTTPLQFRIRDFIRLWGLDNLRTEDWEQFRTNEGHLIPSLVEKLIGVYAKELKTDGVEAPEEFSRLVDRALEKYPSSQNMPYFKATVLISQGKKEEALEYYRSLIMKFPSKYYLWSQAAELTDDIDIKTGLLSKALLCGEDEIFLGRVRLRMAALLITKGLPANAKRELEIYKGTYIAKGWGLKQEYWNVYNTIPSVEAVEDNRDIYSEYSKTADEFIYRTLPDITVVKVSERQIDDRSRPGKKITYWNLCSENENFSLKKPGKFGLKGRTPDGALFSIKVKNRRIVWIKRQNPEGENWLKKVTGEVCSRMDRKGNRFAIVTGVYVGSQLLRHVSDGQIISVLARRQKDGRWSAITLLKS
ncbi:MAG: TTC39/IML2 family protein [Muribaculaceae bacterium]|nr:TTC39/IML2 family protein [Muribaculaceae bacterium]